MVVIEQTKYKMTVKCLKCSKTWVKGCAFPWSHTDVTASLCPKCFKPLMIEVIKRKQRKEGNFDCISSWNGWCDQLRCKYRDLCQTLAAIPDEEVEDDG